MDGADWKGSIATDLSGYDDIFAIDYCGSCRRCIDHCITDAIMKNKVVDGSK
ncbi:hypothetical protein [Ferruginibacter sp.]|uniref:hypothetical protein n=1 Tax=Ferruginibacter sp. TaxID=1940288 RepID=UPI0019A88125|nr:hypothetical protein [Ferruginibacter sp.]MBC7629097.1 hypothetical protein [Ferruginibacter sp.]